MKLWMMKARGRQLIISTHVPRSRSSRWNFSPTVLGTLGIPCGARLTLPFPPLFPVARSCGLFFSPFQPAVERKEK